MSPKVGKAHLRVLGSRNVSRSLCFKGFGASSGKRYFRFLRFFAIIAVLGLCITQSAVQAVETWRILALRADFPAESPDELSTTGTGGFDLRSLAEALPDYRFPYDTPPHDRAYFEQHLEDIGHRDWLNRDLI